jgi:hypothetical protein
MTIWRNVSAEIFFAKVDITKEPITQRISRMFRLRGLEYYKDKDGREKSRVKEFLTYDVNLEGLNWLGNTIKAHLSHEGRCDEPKKRVSVTVDENGRQHAQYVMSGLRDKHYIPFSKKTVDDFLEKTRTDNNTVIYYGRITDGPGSIKERFRCNGYSYEQFVNTEWEDFEELAKRQGGPTGKIKWIPEDRKKYIG